MTREEVITQIKQEAIKSINMAHTQELTSQLLQIGHIAISNGIAPTDVVVAFKCATIAMDRTNEELI